MRGIDFMGFPPNRARAVRGGLLALVCLLLSLGLLSRLDLFEVDSPIRSDRVRHFVGKAYYVRLPSFYGPFLEYPEAPLLHESDEGGEPSPDVLLRNGEQAWRGPSSVAQVVHEGGGRYVLTDPFLLFSGPDSRDPARSGDAYRLQRPVRATRSAVVGLACALCLLFLARRRPCPLFRLSVGLPATLGLLLLSVNLIGLFLPYRNPVSHEEPRFLYGKADVSLGPEEALCLLARAAGEPEGAYAARAAVIVSRALGNCMYNRDQENTGYRVPFWKNFILWALSWLDEGFDPYDFADPRRGLQRAAGRCRQHALVLYGFLVENKVDAGIRLLAEHVLVSVHTRKGERLTLDPDTGVVLPFGLEEASERMDEAEALYKRALPKGLSAFRRSLILRLRLQALSQEDLPPWAGEAWEGQARLEAMAYRAKWGLPPLFLVPALFRIARRRTRSRPRRS